MGVPVPATANLPLYVVADRAGQWEGLRVELVTFQSESGANQALAGGSVDVIVATLRGLVILIGAGHPVRSFSSGQRSSAAFTTASSGTPVWRSPSRAPRSRTGRPRSTTAPPPG